MRNTYKYDIYLLLIQMNNFIFLIFYLASYLCGKSLFILIVKNNKFSKNKIDRFEDINNYIHNLYPLFSIFALGNLVLLLNFFTPIKEVLLLIFGFFIILFIYGIFELYKTKLKDFNLVNQIFIPLVISISSYGIKFHYDAGAYHLNYQNWIYNSKINFGLSNLNPYYSYGSIQEYSASVFKYFNNNLINYFIELVFFVSFFGFIFSLLKLSENLFLKNSSLFVLIYLFLDNFGYKGGGNGALQIQMVGKPDTAVGILWIIITLLIINELIKKHTNQLNFSIILVLCIFAFQLKSNAGPLVILLLFYFLTFRKKLNLFSKFNFYLYFLSISYLIKNFIISGCFLYPINLTCLVNVSWLNFNHIEESTYITLRDNQRFMLGNNFFEWFNNFISHAYNLQIYTNFIFSLFIIFLFKILFFKTIIKNKHLKLNYCFFLLINYLLFFFTVPVFRNAYGLFLSTLLIFTIDEIEYKNNFTFLFNKITFFLLMLFTLLLFPRFFMYSEALNNNFQYKDFDIEKVTYNSSFKGYVVPIESNQCWYKLNCLLPTSSIKKIYSYEKWGYQFFTSSS